MDILNSRGTAASLSMLSYLEDRIRALETQSHKDQIVIQELCKFVLEQNRTNAFLELEVKVLKDKSVNDYGYNEDLE